MILVVTHDACAGHDPGPGHPEAPGRLAAVRSGVSGLGSLCGVVAAEPAGESELLAVHTPGHLARLRSLHASGGGILDPDTVMGPGSLEAALLAAGSGRVAVAGLLRGEARAAFCAVRPPGHHATRDAAMGFCLLNNVAVTAGALAAAGHRPLVVDIDVHHGNGTQDIFWDDPRVGFASFHQDPLYPGTGRLTETGGPRARGTVANAPVPPGSAGPALMTFIERVVAPMVGWFGPDWLLVSVGFDGHRSDPLAGLSLSAGDYGAAARALSRMVPEGRIVAFLEGGYDAGALRACTEAFVAGLAGVVREPEPVTGALRGVDRVELAATHHAELRDRLGSPPTSPDSPTQRAQPRRAE